MTSYFSTYLLRPFHRAESSAGLPEPHQPDTANARISQQDFDGVSIIFAY